MSRKVYLEYDGASKGNPGRSGAGAVLKSEDGRVVINRSIVLQNFLFFRVFFDEFSSGSSRFLEFVKDWGLVPTMPLSTER